MNSSAGLTLGALANTSEPSEAATDIELARNGDAESFAILYQRHLQAVYGYLSSRLPSQVEAEDLTSDVFRRAWSSRRAYRAHGTFKAWIFTIVRRSLADHYRRQRQDGALLTEDADQVQDGGASPEDHAVQDERVREVRALLNGLSPQQREILQLRFAAELTYSEIAVVIGKREEAVKKIAYRALEALRGRTLDA
jgi:RNA polymerase sigma-70 factor (ECF subfamily)